MDSLENDESNKTAGAAGNGKEGNIEESAFCRSHKERGNRIGNEAADKRGAREFSKDGCPQFFVRLYRYPDRKAPIIEPGKARSDPEPMIFLITDVVKAAETPYRVPQRTARKILIMCWSGKARVTPKGKEKTGERRTPAAARRAAKIHFRKEERLSFSNIINSFVRKYVFCRCFFHHSTNKNRIYTEQYNLNRQ